MSERSRIIIVILLVAGYIFLDQRYFKNEKGITATTVIISILIAMVVYSGLVLFFKRKHKS